MSWTGSPSVLKSMVSNTIPEPAVGAPIEIATAVNLKWKKRVMKLVSC